MIPRAYIDEWRYNAPWSQDAWVEQDLVISRSIAELFNIPQLAERLAFRCGTALHKLYSDPSPRYSEDIDLVQITQEPIGETLDILRSVFDPWLGNPRRNPSEGRVTLQYRFDSEIPPVMPLRLKIEITTREHLSHMGLIQLPFLVESRWFAGKPLITTYELEELLGTKLRALYQRNKGRDLFDLSHALNNNQVDHQDVVACFQRYMEHGNHHVTRAKFEANLEQKRLDPSFRDDIAPLLRPEMNWSFDNSYHKVMDGLVSLLPGKPWRGA